MPTVTGLDGEQYPVHEVQLPDTAGWHVVCRDWDGIVVYDGPAPVPTELCTVSLDDALAGRMYSFDMTPPDHDPGGG